MFEASQAGKLSQREVCLRLVRRIFEFFENRKQEIYTPDLKIDQLKFTGSAIIESFCHYLVPDVPGGLLANCISTVSQLPS
jgi:hypothetical protein